MEFGSAGSVPKKEFPGYGKRLAFNPYLPSWEYIPDGEPYVFGDRVYVYGSHDQYDSETFCMGDYVCWSAPVNDLANWRYEGIIYPKTSDPFNPDGHMCLYAPDVTVGPDGKYYLFYVLDKVNVVSVAVCDTPAGRYKFLGYVHYADGTRLGDRAGDEPQFDPGVLTEGDLTYLYTGFCGRGDKSRHGAMLTVLGPDMLTIVEEPKIVVPGSEYSAGSGFEGHAYFEAASIRKKDGKYYFIYSSEVMHELCYATADDPRGEFKYGGVLVSNCDLHIGSYKPAEEASAYGANNHGSMVEIAGKWYIFYHRHTNGNWFSRQGCAEPLEFNADGSIIQAEITSCGLNGGPLPDKGEYPAYIVCNIFNDKHDIYVNDSAARVVQNGGEEQYPYAYIRKITDGMTVGFKYFDCSGVKGLRIFTRAYANGYFEIRAAYNGEVLGQIKVQGTNIWTAGECLFEGKTFPDGKQPLYLTFKGSGGCSLKSFEFLH
ncbi:MAG: family 43 glycosylhydrolase [Lachnospiraceae bacterium]|nr:family 43 glycosylhydrolase [Lachnospiraceae bacterium]